jgi:hypothetical protein
MSNPDQDSEAFLLFFSIIDLDEYYWAAALEVFLEKSFLDKKLGIGLGVPFGRQG